MRTCYKSISIGIVILFVCLSAFAQKYQKPTLSHPDSWTMIVVPDIRTMNQPSQSQWEAAARSFSKLDAKVPYIVCTGNHDYCHFQQKTLR